MKHLEIFFWVVGAALIGAYVALQAWAEVERADGVEAFAQAREVFASSPRSVDGSRSAAITVALPAEVTAAMPPPPASRAQLLDRAVVAVLHLPGLELEIPVKPGTTQRVLHSGAGLIEGSAAPDDVGNVAIAAHRDTYFRSLEHIARGDVVRLDTLTRTRTYRVTEVSVVDPSDVSVLADVGEPVLTLVTCHPFNFVGSAPQRFIVRAVATEHRSPIPGVEL